MNMPACLTPQSVQASIEAIQALPIVPKILATVCQVTGMRFAAVARVTEDRWTACAVADGMGFGLLPGGELELTSTICDEIRQHGHAVIFGRASEHPVFSTHHTPRIYGLESYVSVPMFTAGHQFFGTLCAIDSVPRDFDEGTIVATLQLFANLIESHLVLETRAEAAEQGLEAEREVGQLRERFLAVVGHDLRGPLQAVRLATDLLEPLQVTERAQRLVRTAAQGVERMDGLIADIMDMTRGRLGSGMELLLEDRHDLDAVIHDAVDEVRMGHPNARIEIQGSLCGTARFDQKRMRQLLGNLLGNAVTHGDLHHPVEVRCRTGDDFVEIQVANRGTAIPSAMLPLLFHPFVRPTSHAPRPGLGLGLYIASEIARGHAAILTAQSNDDGETMFTLRMPSVQASV
ncbi:GAF domain-containing sensor histidine kinase [Luteibacter sp. UNCMF366Tsu5.1]|uniref:GAF domain-containing sensor histidine kinase n=1 Tax=Luteibacter sp. UNCMF366Tsu5.1 TaxID=1502758 RepID=UPI0009F9AB32|nr:GAF domain-containing sensor histidine kinase [Luteibacter sp. UNCMF366Tsu5.1]